MAHGFGAERTWRLPAFAERFAEHGLATLFFDYRSFGDSDGEPRNLVSPRRHVADWAAAVDHARSLSGVDGDRLALWGTSFWGGPATRPRHDGTTSSAFATPSGTSTPTPARTSRPSSTGRRRS
jgi:fermentation-respiration switch protein FrsA (DUF1100 family)